MVGVPRWVVNPCRLRGRHGCARPGSGRAWIQRTSNHEEAVMTTITHETPNGVDVTQLGQTVEAIRNDPTLAIFTFRATNDWLGAALPRLLPGGGYGVQRRRPGHRDPQPALRPGGRA